MKKIISQLQTYQAIALTPSFLMECYDFIESMKFYHISVDELPDKTQAQQEIKTILNNIFPIQTAQDIWNEAVLRVSDCSNVYIYDAFYSLKDEKILNILTSKRGAHHPITKAPATKGILSCNQSTSRSRSYCSIYYST